MLECREECESVLVEEGVGTCWGHHLVREGYQGPDPFSFVIWGKGDGEGEGAEQREEEEGRGEKSGRREADLRRVCVPAQSLTCF